ncbi:hypothetical protein HC928_23890 [bacterium]|nr:hypothetical protein [bacterium]
MLGKRISRISDWIFTIEKVLSPKECQRYITLGDRAGYKTTTVATVGGRNVVPGLRNHRQAVLYDATLAVNLWQRLALYVPLTLDRRWAIGVSDRLRIARYDVGERQALHASTPYENEHGDRVMLAVSIPLNKNYEGGEIRFLEMPPWAHRTRVHSLDPDMQTAIVARREILQESAPVTRGQKYMLRFDILYGPPTCKI